VPRRLWLGVLDAQAAGAALAAAGVALLGEPRELRTGWVVEVADPWRKVKVSSIPPAGGARRGINMGAAGPARP
jgi:hypothetical protein